MQVSPNPSAAEAKSGGPRALALAVLISGVRLALTPLEGHGGNLLPLLAYYLFVIWIGFTPGLQSPGRTRCRRRDGLEFNKS
jgi:hypothetical protein